MVFMLHDLEFEQFEKDAIARILTTDWNGSSGNRCRLLHQYETAEIIKRCFTVRGYHIEFSIPDKTLRLRNGENSEIGNTLG